MDKSKYPADWKEISARIRSRANNCCEICGVPNGVLIYRHRDDPEQYDIVPDPISEADVYRIFGGKPISEMARTIKVVLTVAHLDHDTTNNSDGNLTCLCQFHHLRHDAKLHAEHAKTTRANRKRQKQEDAGQQKMPL